MKKICEVESFYIQVLTKKWKLKWRNEFRRIMWKCCMQSVLISLRKKVSKVRVGLSMLSVLYMQPLAYLPVFIIFCNLSLLDLKNMYTLLMPIKATYPLCHCLENHIKKIGLEMVESFTQENVSEIFLEI